MNIKKLNHPTKVKIILVVVLIGALLIGQGLFNNKDANRIYYGTLEGEEYQVCAQMAGIIQSIKVNEGDLISVNQLLGTLDYSDEATRLEQSKIGLEASKNDLMALDEGARKEEIEIQNSTIAQLQAQRTQVQSNLKKAKSLVSQNELLVKNALLAMDQKSESFEDSKALYESGALSQEALTNAKTAYETAQNAANVAQAALNAAQADVQGVGAQERAVLAQIQSAQSRLEMLEAGATERALKTGQYNVDQKALNLALAQSTYQKTQIVSLVKGKVQSINYKTGEYVTPGTPVINLIDETDQTIKIYVPEKILPRLKTGMEVTIKSTVGTVEGKGIVTFISDKALYTPMNIVTVKDREKLVFEVKVTLKKAIPELKPGTLVEVQLWE